MLDLIARHGVESQIEFQSFDTVVCRELIDSRFAGPVLWTSETKPPLSGLVSGGYTGCSLYYFNLDDGYLQQSHALGLRVYVWTVSSPKDAIRLLDMGADVIIMDYSE